MRQWDQARRLGRLVAALLTAAAVSAALAPAAGADVRVGKNRPLLPDANPVHGRDAVGLAVNPRNPRHIVAVYTDLVTLHCEVATSFNGGRRWRSVRLKAPAGYVNPACTVGRHLSALLDQSIAFGRGNTVYTTFSSAVVDPQGEPQGKSIMVARSTDGGRSFPTATVALAGAVNPAQGDYTLPKLTVQRGARGRADRIFVVASSTEDNPSNAATEENTVLVSSSDGGRTWTRGPNVNPAGLSSIEPSQPVLGEGGALYVAWRTRERGSRPGEFVPEGRIVVSRSTNRGATWRHSTAAGVRGYTYTGPPQPPFTTQRTFTGSAYPQLAADRRSGNVYLVYGNGGQPTRGGSAVAADHFIHPDIDVWFQRSTDDGASWSEPARLNRQAPIQLEVTQTRHPNLAVAPGGRVDVVWQDRRHWYRGCLQTHAPCEEGRLGDTYYRYSADRGRSFSSERRITDRSMNNDVGFDYRYGAYWAYGPQTVAIGRSRLLVAWMDSRNGNPETDTMDIYLANVNLKGSPLIRARAVPRTSASNLAVRLSRMAYPGGGESVLAGVFASRPWSRVVIVNERDVASALAGGVLARAHLGPVLLSPGAGLSPAVKAEVARLAPIGAFLIGGEGSLSNQVAADLAATGIPAGEIVRIAGPDSAGTANRIAMRMDRRTAQEKQAGRPAFSAAVIVNPASPEAASVSVLAANRRLPVLHASRDSVPAATSDALRALAIDRTLVIGGEESISDGAMAQLPQPQRIGDGDAASVSLSVLAESRRRGLPWNVVFAGRASRRMDAAVMGAAVGRIGALMLLTPGGAKAAGAALSALGMRDNVDHLMVVDRPRQRRAR
jgi:BNR repeat-like domain/ell wall binding domain 2 (CWB2)